jgi:hypothetical protein
MYMFNHLKKLRISYLTHLIVAISFATICICTAIVFAIHAIIPCIFVNTGSKMIAYLNSILNEDDDELPYYS